MFPEVGTSQQGREPISLHHWDHLTSVPGPKHDSGQETYKKHWALHQDTLTLGEALN